jgi:aminopeptidase N
MNFRLLIVGIFVLGLGVAISAQEITRDDFRRSEWEMKSLYYQKLMERQEPGLTLDQSDYDVKYWELDINVTNIEGEMISGKVTMTSEAVVDNLQSIDYDFHYSMNVDSVFMYGEPAAFDHQGSALEISLDQTYNAGQQFTTVVYYNGHPPGGGFGSFAWDDHQGIPIVSTLSEPEGAREWWPCKDMPHDKADSADVMITVPDDLVATSNGVMVSDEDNGDGTRTFHWHVSYPITTYLISLAITNYQSFTDWYVNAEGDSMPVTHYVYPEDYDDAVEDLSITPSAIAIFADLFGEYPFFTEKYGHSEFPWGGAMEHQCNTSYGWNLIRGDHYYDWILVHELGHQWFGDMITCDTWPDVWMNEGFASYLEALWTEVMQGYEAYISYMRYNNSVDDPSGPIYDPDYLFDPNTVYDKGSWVLHMLRGVMGDEAFFEGMYGYANHPDHQYGTIQTLEFRDIMAEYYGQDLDWFFDEWVWGENRPHYNYSWISEEDDNGRWEVFMHIDQTQGYPAPAVFIMPIKVYPRIDGVDTLVTVWNDSREDDVRFVVSGEPSMIRFDIDHWILREVQEESYGMNIVVTELPDGYLDADYYSLVESRGGTPPYSYAVVDSSLPPGLELDGETGEITGRPTTEGQYGFTIGCTDSSEPPETDEQQYVVNIFTTTDVPEEEISVPSNFALIGNYPNPFNSSTVIKFRLAEAGNVTVEIFNLLGQKVETLVSGSVGAGEHELLWNGDGVPSGVYFYRLKAGDRSSVRKMALIK